MVRSRWTALLRIQYQRGISASGGYVDKVLKGTNPGELPVEQPNKFELVNKPEEGKGARIKIPQTRCAATVIGRVEKAPMDLRRRSNQSSVDAWSTDRTTPACLSVRRRMAGCGPASGHSRRGDWRE